MSDSAGPWYSAGLRFECTQCGDCCSSRPGFVWVNQAEINDLAAALDLTPDEFEERYVRAVGSKRSLRERENYDCVLLDGQTRRCTVYAQRPRQCRTWPFWNSNVATPENWKHTCSICPGCNLGDVVPLTEIQERLKVIKI